MSRHRVVRRSISMFTSWSAYFSFMWSSFPLTFSFSLQLVLKSLWNRQSCFFQHFYLKYSPTVLLSFWLIFCQFQPGVAYKSVAYKKVCNVQNLIRFRSSRSWMFFKIGVLKNLAIFTGKRLCWSHFLIKLRNFMPLGL